MNIKYYLCEDIRQEANGKVILIGLYPDNTIVIPKPEKTKIGDQELELTVLQHLQIMLNVSDVEGEVEVKGRFIQPNNKTKSGIQELGRSFIPKGKSHNFILDVSNFPAVGEGEYSFATTVNDKEFTFPIIINYEN